MLNTEAGVEHYEYGVHHSFTGIISTDFMRVRECYHVVSMTFMQSYEYVELMASSLFMYVYQTKTEIQLPMPRVIRGTLR